MCAPEGSSACTRLKWAWRNAYYRGTATYTAAVVTLVAVLQVTGTGC